MVLGKLPMPARPTKLDNSRARTYCACSSWGSDLFCYLYKKEAILVAFCFAFLAGEVLPKRGLLLKDRICS